MRVYWNQSTDIFDVVHPYSINGSTVDHMTVEDFFFIGNVDSFDIYKFDGFDADRSNHDPPNVYVSSVHVTDAGYAVFKVTFMSYSLMGFSFTNDTDGNLSKATYPEFNAAMDKIVLNSPVFYSMGNRSSSIAYSPVVIPTDTSNETDWAVVSGGLAPVFSATKVEPHNVSIPNNSHVYDRYVTFPDTFSGGNLGKWDAGQLNVRLNPRAIRIDGYEVTTFNSMINISVLNTGLTAFGTVTEYTSLYGNGVAQEPNTRVEQSAGEYLAIGINRYTGSKTEQGIIDIVSVDSNYAITHETYISAPVAGRYGLFGGVMEIVKVTDSTYGEDIQVWAWDAAAEEIYIFSRERSWALHQTISIFDKNDYPRTPNGFGSLMTWLFFDDSATAWLFKCWTYDGSTWSESFSGILPIMDNWNMLSETRFAGVDTGIDAAKIYDETGTIISTGSTLPFNPYDGSIMGGVGQYVGITYYQQGRWDIYDTSHNLVALCTPQNNYYYTVGYIPDVNSAIMWNGASMYIYPGQVTKTYSQGWSAIKTDGATAKFTKLATDSVIGGSMEYTLASYCTISWAVSFDAGTSWTYYDGVGETWEIADLDATSPTGNMGLAQYFDEAMESLIGDDFLNMDFCIRFDMSQETAIESNVRSVTANKAETLEETIEIEMYKGSNEHYVNAAVLLPTEYVTLNIVDASNPDYWVNLSFFDDLL